jgi:curved DNA-binding protein CbpA
LKERKLYDILGIEPEANSGQIKKAYYIKARQFHPDRHQDDPKANENFQMIGEAYQVLSDERLRFIYDSKGKDSLNDTHNLSNYLSN